MITNVISSLQHNINIEWGKGGGEPTDIAQKIAYRSTNFGQDCRFIFLSDTAKDNKLKIRCLEPDLRQRIFRCPLINMNLVFHISEDGSEIESSICLLDFILI